MKGVKGKFYTLGISTLDCTGCGSCADVCPARKKAITMQDAETAYVNEQQERYNYLFNEVTEKEVPFKAPKGFDLASAQLILHNYPDSGSTMRPYEVRVYLWNQ